MRWVRLYEIDEIIALVQDGQWHPLEEIIDRTTLPKPKTKEIIQFLTDYGFIFFKKELEKVKVTTSFKEFLEGDQTTEASSPL